MYMEVVLSHSPPDSSSLRQGLNWVALVGLKLTETCLPHNRQTLYKKGSLSLYLQLTILALPVSHRDSPVSVSLALYFIKVYFCTWVLWIKLRFSCFFYKHFIDRAISPAPILTYIIFSSWWCFYTARSTNFFQITLPPQVKHKCTDLSAI